MLSVRCNVDDEKLIREFANYKNMSVSEFLRQTALEKIEEEYDLKLVLEYIKNKENMKFFTSDEIEKELGLWNIDCYTGKIV